LERIKTKGGRGERGNGGKGKRAEWQNGRRVEEEENDSESNLRMNIE